MHILRRSLLCLIVMTLVTGCATTPPRLRESGMNSRFAFDRDAPFDEYIRQSEKMIEKARVDIHEANRDVIMNANRPFELRPDEARYPRTREGRYERGILLIHGLADSPYLLKPIARCLQERGFLVRAILLPGHGTVPGDLLSVRYPEWVRATEYGVHQLKPCVEKLYLGGISTGGALCIRAALQDQDIRGLILFAPAAGIRSRWAGMAEILMIFSKWLAGEEDDRDYAKYETFAVHSGAQVYHLTREIDAAWASGKRLSIPVFVAASADDISVDTDKMRYIFNTFMTSPQNRMVIYSREGADANPVRDGRILFLNSYWPEERILAYAHVSLIMPPEDPHYGKKGGYRDCLHYRDDREKRMACLHDPSVWLGEVTDDNLKKFTLRRLTYHPRYNEMIGILNRFLDGLN